MAQKDQKTTAPVTVQAEGSQGHSSQNQPQLLKLFHENWKLIVGVIGGVLLIMSVYAGYSYYREYRWEQATNELSTIMVRTAGMERVNALNQFMEGSPEGLKPSIRLELAMTYDRNERYDEAAQAWKVVAETDKGDLRVPALMARAYALKNADKPDEAVAQYEALLLTAPEPYKMSILRQMALAAEAAEMWDKAIDIYATLINDAQSQDTVFFKEKMKMLQAMKQG